MKPHEQQIGAVLLEALEAAAAPLTFTELEELAAAALGQLSVRGLHDAIQRLTATGVVVRSRGPHRGAPARFSVNRQRAMALASATQTRGACEGCHGLRYLHGEPCVRCAGSGREPREARHAG